MSDKYTINNFNLQFPDDNSCLQFLFQKRFGSLKVCPSCAKETKFNRISKRKCYCCQFCGHQVHPLAETIFHKSDTPLKSWFYAIFLFANSKNGVSGKELQRQLGVTYKCAWRMAKQIRLLFSKSGGNLSGIVEADETYVGARRKKGSKRGRGGEHKTAVFGLVQRKGDVRAKVVPNTQGSTVLPIMRENVELGSCVMTDEFAPYNKVRSMGYIHRKIKHSSKQWVKGDIYTNTIEGFWSQLKRGINGTYHAVSPKYLQSYVDEFSYRYNLRNSDASFFPSMLEEVVRQA